MGTYWDNFIEKYAKYLHLPLNIILEGFWNYSNERVSYCDDLLFTASQQNVRYSDAIGDL